MLNLLFLTFTLGMLAGALVCGAFIMRSAAAAARPRLPLAMALGAVVLSAGVVLGLYRYGGLMG